MTLFFNQNSTTSILFMVLEYDAKRLCLIAIVVRVQNYEFKDRIGSELKKEI